MAEHRSAPPALLIGLIKSLRPHQWIKNVFLFAALIFAERFGDPHSITLALAGLAVFCALASAVYLVNDIMDRDNDRLHPIKQHRPIASGVVPLPAAWSIALLLTGGGLLAAWRLGEEFLIVSCTYAVLSYLYCFWLKRVVILDVMVLASGYPLRAVAGAAAIGVQFSSWLLICTSLLALFLGFCKRRQELVSLADGASAHRAVLAGYSERFLDQMIAVVTASTVISYMLYALSDEVAHKLHTHGLGLTVPFVLYGVFRYFYLVHMRGEGGRPSREVVADKPLLVNILLYSVSVVLILYFKPWPTP
jgi:4-hydroxybenzoate polyprenyltransferase